MSYVLEIKTQKMLGGNYASFVLIDNPLLHPRLSVYSIKTKKPPKEITANQVIATGTLIPDYVGAAHFPIIPQLQLKLAAAQRIIRQLEAAHLRVYIAATKKLQAA